MKLDMRASLDLNREAVKGDLRSNASKSMALAPAYEQSDEESSNEDPFDNLLKQTRESQV